MKNKQTLEKKSVKESNERGITLIALILIILSVVIIVSVSLVIVLGNKNSSGSNKEGSTNIDTSKEQMQQNENDYKILLAGDISSKRKLANGKTEVAEIIEKLESDDGKGVEISGNLKLLSPEYTCYSVFGSYTNNFYSVHINKNHLLFPAKIEQIYNMGFYLVDSNFALQTLTLKFNDTNTQPTDNDLPNTKQIGNWNFKYNNSIGKIKGYYALNRGYLILEMTNKELTDSNAIEDLLEKLSQAFELQSEDIHLLDTMAREFGTSCYFVLEDKYKNIKLNDTYTLNLVDNVNIIHWYVNQNWLSNDIRTITKDGKYYITIRESINDYNLDEITSSSQHIEIVPYTYNETELNLIYAKYEEGILAGSLNDSFVGFIININNKSYTFTIDTNQKNMIYKGTDPKDIIDYIFENLLQS